MWYDTTIKERKYDDEKEWIWNDSSYECVDIFLTCCAKQEETTHEEVVTPPQVEERVEETVPEVAEKIVEEVVERKTTIWQTTQKAVQ